MAKFTETVKNVWGKVVEFCKKAWTAVVDFCKALIEKVKALFAKKN